MTTTRTEPEPEIADHTTTFSRDDYHGPRTQHIETDGGTVSITVGLTTNPGIQVTTVTYTADEGWRAEHADDGVIRFVRTVDAAKPAGWQQQDLLTFPNTREFTNADHPGLVVIVQTAVCHDPGTGRSRLGLATNYLDTEHTSDPLYNVHRSKVVHTAVDVPLPCEVEADRALAEFDPGTLTWDGGYDVPGQNDGWLTERWPENLLDRN
jgi:hypothetical protein